MNDKKEIKNFVPIREASRLTVDQSENKLNFTE
jgi:hypothetical protein